MKVYNFNKRLAMLLFLMRVLVLRSSKVFGSFCPLTYKKPLIPFTRMQI